MIIPYYFGVSFIDFPQFVVLNLEHSVKWCSARPAHYRLSSFKSWIPDVDVQHFISLKRKAFIVSPAFSNSMCLIQIE